MTCAPVAIDAATYLTAAFKFGRGRPTAGGVIRRTASIPHALFAVLLLGAAAYAITRDDAVRNVVQVGMLLLMIYGALRAEAARPAWWLLIVANAAWAIGDFDPWRLNALYMVSYVFAHLGLVALLAHQARLRWRTALALDGVIAGLAAAAVLTSFVSTAYEGTGVRVPATSLAGDAVLVTTIVLAFALSGWRPARAWWVIASGEVILVAMDLLTIRTPVPTHGMLVAWVVAFLLTSYAVFHPASARVRPQRGIASSSLPIAGGALAVALLMYIALNGGSAVSVWLAGSAIIAGLLRATLLLLDNQKLLERTRADATTDKLTGLPNRRALTDDLDEVLRGGRERTLAFFDLDGFKEYNDTFGHRAGDALLQRIAPRLGGYRLGGDEFCLLLDGALDDGAPEIGRAVAALTEGPVTASYGLVVIPREATTATDALALADERMYARKRRRRATHVREILRALAEGEAGVTRIAAEIGLVALSDASSAAHAPAGSSAGPLGTAHSASPGP
jgi:diguanylate cyclase (GGDEF)-like protein